MKHMSVVSPGATARPRVPPGPRGAPGLGSLVPFHRDPNGFLLRLASRYGDISRFTVARREFFLLNHPDLVHELLLVTRSRHLKKGRLIERARRFLGDGLITSEEPRHLKQRRLIQPHFDGSHLKQFGDIVSRQLERLLAAWSLLQFFDLDVAMRAYALSVVAKALFDADIEADAAELGGALRDIERGYPLLMLPRWFERIPIPPIRRAHKARKYLDDSIFRLICEREGAGGADLVSRLACGGQCPQREKMPQQLIRDEIVTLFVAGHETTANALTWALYLVATHPAVEKKLVAELHSVLGGRMPNTTDLPALRYTEMIFSETLRLYPPVGRMGRRCSSDIEIGTYTIPADSIMFVSPYAMHRDPRFFPQPDTFDPERWAIGMSQTRPRFSYFPYGAGLRMCIGARFANMIGVLTIAAVMQRWRLLPREGYRVVPRRTMTMAPRYGVPITLARR